MNTRPYGGDPSKLLQRKLDITFHSKPKPTVTVDLSRGHGLNLWREERIGGKPFCSDAVMERVKNAGLRTFPKLRAIHF